MGPEKADLFIFDHFTRVLLSVHSDNTHTNTHACTVLYYSIIMFKLVE